MNNINIKDGNKNSKIISTQDDAGIHTPSTIAFGYKKIHEGIAYMTHVRDAALGNGASISIYFKTPDTTKTIHVVVLAYSSSAAVLEVLEAPTVTAGTGSDLGIFNRNRTSSQTTTVLNNAVPPVAGGASKTVITTNDGTIFHFQTLGTGQKESGETRDVNEFILATNTEYIFRITSSSAGNSVYVSANYYEL